MNHEQLINGRSLFLFTIPILLSSVLLRPYFSFITTIVVGIMLNLLAFNNGLDELQFLTPLSLFGVALVAWITSKSLDDALKELRIINEELDQRVEERTQALQIANSQLQEEIGERIKIERELVITRDQAVSANNFKSELLARSKPRTTYTTRCNFRIFRNVARQNIWGAKFGTSQNRQYHHRNQ